MSDRKSFQSHTPGYHFGADQRPDPMLIHRQQWPGHKITRGENANPVFITGDSLREGDHILLPEGRMLIAEGAGHRESDLFLVTLEPVP